MKREHATYRERTWAPAWVWVLVWGACLAAVGATAYGAAREPMSTTALVLTLGAVLFFPVLMSTLFLRLDVEVRADHLFIAFGPVHLVRKRIAYHDMESAEAVTYSPLREFGGWGIRPTRRKTAWTIRGNKAVRVVLRSGKQVYVGSRFPQRLAGRIALRLGTRR
ncbi:MAG: DUF3093 family protein [Gemmatimonadetes bacterium]|nr:DUF3093 family protein [Gemmatimonadota bacterium]